LTTQTDVEGYRAALRDRLLAVVDGHLAVRPEHRPGPGQRVILMVWPAPAAAELRLWDGAARRSTLLCVYEANALATLADLAAEYIATTPDDWRRPLVPAEGAWDRVTVFRPCVAWGR
jgi:hypothetical protein